MPWSAKAQELLRSQYAAVGAAATATLGETVAALQRAAAHGADVSALLTKTQERVALSKKYVDAYRQYCWPVASVDDLRIAPFHLLASEGRVHADKDHAWHIQTLERLCAVGAPLLFATSHRLVEVTDPPSEAAGVKWGEETHHTWRGRDGR